MMGLWGLVFIFYWLLGVAFGKESDFFGFLELSDELKQEWVDTHNYFRRLVNDPEAANMRLMTWDDELAEVSKRVVSTCKFTHTSTSELTTSVFPRVGENLYTGDNFRYSQMMTKDGVTKAWYDELPYYDYDSATCDAGQICGHYTQVVWDRSYKVGCAIAECRDVEGGYGSFLVGCNYGPAGNEVLYNDAVKPYTSGEACSACEDGDLCVDQLCNNTARDIPFTTTTTAPDTTTAVTTMAGETTAVSTVANGTTQAATAPEATTNFSTIAIATSTTETDPRSTAIVPTTSKEADLSVAATVSEETTHFSDVANTTAATKTYPGNMTIIPTTSKGSDVSNETATDANATTTTAGGARSVKTCAGTVQLLIGLLMIIFL